MSNRTWACIECGRTYRRDQSIEQVRCAECGQACEYVHWKVRVPSPKDQRAWASFWEKYLEEKRLLAKYRDGTLREPVNLEILGMDLEPGRRQ